MSDDATTPREDAYRDGYVAGYQAGLGDGRGQGYSDAKYRAFVALEAAKLDEHARRSAREAIVNILGHQS